MKGTQKKTDLFPDLFILQLTKMRAESTCRELNDFSFPSVGVCIRWRESENDVIARCYKHAAAATAAAAAVAVLINCLCNEHLACTNPTLTRAARSAPIQSQFRPSFFFTSTSINSPEKLHPRHQKVIINVPLSRACAGRCFNLSSNCIQLRQSSCSLDTSLADYGLIFPGQATARPSRSYFLCTSSLLKPHFSESPIPSPR